jgi:F420-non-reducing hydrogenase iron-sulfur subunit
VYVIWGINEKLLNRQGFLKMNTAREIDSDALPGGAGAQLPVVTVFVCANCARAGKKSTSANRTRPALPEFVWPFPVDQIIVPCSGRIQPEHILKTFESGADLVVIIACQEDNCHYIEGSPRCFRRVEFIRSILEEIGLGEERLLLAYLPGSASEDLLVTAGKTATARESDALDKRIAKIRDHVVKALDMLSPNPLRQIDAAEVSGSNSRERLDRTNDRKNE